MVYLINFISCYKRLSVIIKYFSDLSNSIPMMYLKKPCARI